MTLNFRCNSEEQMRNLSSSLQTHDFESCQVDFNLDHLSSQDAENFLRELSELGIEYKELEKLELNVEEDPINYDEYDPKSLLTPLKKPAEICLTHKWEGDEDIITEKIEDKELVYLTRRLYGEANLLNLAKICKIDLKFDEKIEIAGFRDTVKRIMFKITGICRTRTRPMGVNIIQCLSENPAYQSMLEKYKTKVVVEDKMDGERLSLYVCGDEQEIVEKCKAELEKVILEIGEEKAKRENNDSKFSLDNLHEGLFFIEDVEDGVEILEKDDILYKKLESLLRKGYPEADLALIAKKYYDDKWQRYLTARNSYNKSDVRESLLFYESPGNPVDIGEIDISNEDLQKNLRENIHPKKGKFYQSKDGDFNVLVYVVLCHVGRPKEIIDYYPAYYLVLA